MSTPNEELIDAARRNTLALCLAQLGDVNAMAHDEALRVLDEIGDDANSVYVLVRLMTTVITAFAGHQASSLTTAGVAAEHDIASELIRIAITEVSLTAHPRDSGE